MYQQVTVLGNLGSEPEMRYTPKGRAVTNFSVAANKRYTNSAGEQVEQTTWLRVACWGNLAETTNQYLSKGRQVLIVGELNPGENGNPRLWTGDNGEVRASYEITAQTIKFLGGRSDNGAEEPAKEISFTE